MPFIRAWIRRWTCTAVNGGAIERRATRHNAVNIHAQHTGHNHRSSTAKVPRDEWPTPEGTSLRANSESADGDHAAIQPRMPIARKTTIVN